MFFMILGLRDLFRSNKPVELPPSFIGYVAIELLIEAAIGTAIYVMWVSVLS